MKLKLEPENSTSLSLMLEDPAGVISSANTFYPRIANEDDLEIPLICVDLEEFRDIRKSMMGGFYQD